MGATDHRHVRVLPRAQGQSSDQPVHPHEELVGGADEQHREARVEDVARGHSTVEPAGRLAGELLDVGQERDHVVVGRPLDLEDRVGVDRELLLAQRCGRSRGDDARFFHGLAGGKLDLEPCLEARAIRPQLEEVRRGVPWNHRRQLGAAKLAEPILEKPWQGPDLSRSAGSAQAGGAIPHIGASVHFWRRSERSRRQG